LVLATGAGAVERYNIDSTGISTWSVAGTTAMTLNSTGLGVGVTPSAGKFEALEAGTGSGLGGIFASTATAGGNPGFVFRTASTNRWAINLAGGAGVETLRFYDINASTTRMTLNASGNLMIGSTGTLPTRLHLSGDAGTTNWAVGPYTSAATNFYITANNAQGVFLNGTAATAWTAISDERFKDIIEPITNAVSKVGSLRSVIGKFKTDAEGTRRSFLIAQDVLAAFPEAAVATDPDKLGVTYTEIIPLLVAAIKELTAEVNALKNA